TWLEGVEGMWLRVGDVCRPINFDSVAKEQDGRSATLELCHETIRKADVECTASVQLGQVFRETGHQACHSTLPSGAGSGSISAGGLDDGSDAWSLVASDELQLHYAKTWDLWVEAERLMFVDGNCSAASLKALDAILAA